MLQICKISTDVRGTLRNTFNRLFEGRQRSQGFAA